LTVFRADDLLVHGKSVVRSAKNATVISGVTPTYRRFGPPFLKRGGSDTRRGFEIPALKCAKGHASRCLVFHRLGEVLARVGGFGENGLNLFELNRRFAYPMV
jgi:hypothetical protein